MALGLVLALMLAAAVFAVLWPLSRSRARALEVGGGAAEGDVAVYRDQLAELERDRSAGLIGAVEGDAARVEISRRLLGAADAAPVAQDAGDGLWRRRATAAAALVLMPIGVLAFYLLLGSPNLPGRPLSARMDDQQDRSLASLIARVESHLEQQPDDGRGWEVIAPIYLRLGRFDDAVQANRNLVKFLGDTPQRDVNLAEALVAQANGVVTAEAKVLLEQALAQHADEPRIHFYLGLAAEQDGRRDDAARIWRELVEHAPAGAAWVPAVRQALARVDGTAQAAIQGSSQASSPANGPSADEISAASEMSPADRQRMIHAMVDRLAARLHDNGSDVDGWLSLIRAHMVLGERDEARAAVVDARRALKDAPEKLRRIEDGAKNFGLDG